MPKTSIIMIDPSNVIEYIKDSVDSIRRFTEFGSYELIIVDDGRSPALREWLLDQTHIKSLFFENNLTAGQALNLAIRASSGEHIVFMHSDTLVTERWLDLLNEFVNCDDRIASVAPATNRNTDHSINNAHFLSIEEMLQYASDLKNNGQYKKSIFLSSTCLLFKKNALENTGLFNESMTEVACFSDYQMRLHQGGWKSYICEHAFVYHYGANESQINTKDQILFSEKWGFSLKECQTGAKVLKMIKKSPEEAFRILLYGVKNPEILLILQESYPNCLIKCCSTQCKEAVGTLLFDYVWIEADYFSKSTLEIVKECLSDTGELIAELKNANSYILLKNIILKQRGYSAEKEWSLEHIATMFELAGFQELDFDYQFASIKEDDSYLIGQLGEFVETLPEEFAIQSFLVTARKHSKQEQLVSQLKELIDDSDKELRERIVEYGSEVLIPIIEKMDESAIAIHLLNEIGIHHLECGHTDEVIPYLTKAYELDCSYIVTLFNWAKVMHKNGEDEEALRWLLQIEHKTEQISEWIADLQQTINHKQFVQNKMKFLLRRIEHDIERQEALDELIESLNSKTMDLESIFKLVQIHAIDKIEILNRLSVTAFNREAYEFVIPFLERSYAIHPSEPNTLFNLGSVLSAFGAYDEAMNFLMQIEFPDEEVLRLIREIERNMTHE